MRVSELASELGVSAVRLLAGLQKVGLGIDDADTVVPPEIETKIRVDYARWREKQKSPTEVTVLTDEVQVDSRSATATEQELTDHSRQERLLQRGTIKFVSTQRGYGYIIPENGGRDVRFELDRCDGDVLDASHKGQMVEFSLAEDGPSQATYLRVLQQSGRSLRGKREFGGYPGSHRLGDALTRWAFVPFVPFTHRNGRRYSSVLELLAELALKERWSLGSDPSPGREHAILESYLKFTFYRLTKEDADHQDSHKISEAQSDRTSFAAFNTGLVDRLYEPIYALFERNDRPGSQPWKFYDFCVPGQGAGKILTAYFRPLPDPPKYFDSTSDMLLDTTQELHLDIRHIVIDGIKRNRYPSLFLAEHVPEGIAWQDYGQLGLVERREYLKSFGEAVEADAKCYRSIKRRVEDAAQLAVKRTRWNFKTAIPQYYPRENEMSLLLPLAIQNDEIVDVALVISRNPLGSYQGATILPLAWAYKNARLVCRPDSDWLSPEGISLDVGEDE
jgi:cold shock CspA family protein